MSILYLAQRIPYPPNKGDKIRTYHQLKYLSQHHEVFVAALYDQKEDLDYAQDLASLAQVVGLEYVDPRLDKVLSLRGLLTGAPLSVPYFYKHSLQARIDDYLKRSRPEVIFCFSSVTAQYVFCSKAIGQGYRPFLVMDFCDLDSDKWRQYSQTFVFPFSWIYQREARLLLEYEKQVNQSFDLSLFVSRAEADLFLECHPQAKGVKVVANGVDTDYFRPDVELASPSVFQELENKFVLLFTGAMDYPANVDGVLWFYETIYLTLLQDIPELAFLIVGSNPDRRVMALHGRDGVMVTGFVPDIRPYYQRADVSVVPLRLARGVQNKVLEAMAMARAVVLTPKAAEGIGHPGEQVFIEAHESKEFSRQILELYKDPEKRQCMGDRARGFVLRYFSWASNLAVLDGELSRAMGKE